MLTMAVLREPRRSAWLVFERAAARYVAWTHDDVLPMLAEVCARVETEQLHAVGFLAYEAAPVFDAALTTRARGAAPLALFSLFDAPPGTQLPACDPQAVRVRWDLDTSRSTYTRNVATIRAQIELGNCYQVNYTLRQSGRLKDTPWAYFCNVAADAPYAAYLECDDFTIVSASPELFFSLEGSRLTCRPMKGTARRAMTTEADRRQARQLHESGKDRAENIMITDMIRNDLGRVAKPGSVVVDSLYDIEKYPTVWQMTSTVSAQSDADLPDIFAALFPCASVTGAPKAASMQIIADLESSARGVYTGAIGYIAPSRRAQFSVAIRTTSIDRLAAVATYGIGSGIVWDSNPDDEFDECRAKAAVLAISAHDRQFELLETLRWSPGGGYFLLEEHLERMRTSSEYFDFEFNLERTLEALQAQAAGFDDRSYRVRLTMSREGRLALEWRAQPDRRAAPPWRVRLAAAPVDREDRFLYHKTTRRQVYAQALESAADCDDVLLWNGDGYLTESTIANLVVHLDGERVTPPVECGLLNGTFRQHLLRQGELVERKVHLDELAVADRITLLNSVRGEFAAQLL